MTEQQPALHTLVFSDIHLTTAEKPDPTQPLWKRYKQRDLFVDRTIADMLNHFGRTVDGRIECVLNGDIFDFDAVTQLPEPLGETKLSWIEQDRGMNATAAKSAWKMGAILDDHPVFVGALRQLLDDGHRVVFVVGNHDLDLLWPSVQEVVRERLGRPPVHEELRFCEWFYISGRDTLIEHGHQYDSYCLSLDPVWPTVRVGDEVRVRLPFGNYASRVLINQMGWFNPHVESSWNMSFWGYVVFFYRHILRSHPFLPVAWIWSATLTLWLSVRDGLLPAERDVLRLDERVEEIASKAQATPRTVRGLRALRAHPAFFEPWRIARELWLDRALLFVLLVVGTFQLFATGKVVFGFGLWWWGFFLVLLFPPFIFYARNVSTETDGMERYVRRRADLIAAVAGVSRIVLGHSHVEHHTNVGDVELLNAGTWSPAFKDVACTEPEGRKCLVWIRPGPAGERIATLETWWETGLERLPWSEEDKPVVRLANPANLLGR